LDIRPNSATDRLSARHGLLSLLHRREATVAVEFALIAIPLFTFLFGVIEVGRLLWMQNALHYSVEEASRCAALSGTACSTAGQPSCGTSACAIESYAASRSGYPFDSSVFGNASNTPTPPSCSNGTCCVNAQYRMSAIIPFVALSPTLYSQSCFPSAS
jgi:Flp pilus assembly protein TadG